MCGGAKITSEIRICVDCGKSSRSSEITVFANQRVDGFVFAKFLDTGSKDDEVGAISQGHTGAINSLVAEPGGVELMGIEIDDGFLNWLVEYFEVDFLT